MTMIASTALILLTVVNLVTLAGALFSHAIAAPADASRSWFPLVVVNAAASLMLTGAVILGYRHVPGQRDVEVTTVGYLASIWFFSTEAWNAMFRAR